MMQKSRAHSRPLRAWPCPAQDSPHAGTSAPSGVGALQKDGGADAAPCVLEINLDLHLGISAAFKSVHRW